MDIDVVTDRFGLDVTVGTPDSVAEWDRATREAQDFRGERGDRLTAVTEADGAFAMGLVVILTDAVLGGDDPTADPVRDGMAALVERSAAVTQRERDHAAAVTALVAGEYTEAAECWEEIGARHPHDMVATGSAHDVYLHVGDDARRLRSSEATLARLVPGDPGYGVAAGQHAFALEEVGRFAEAECHARTALDVDPVDVWALHALAHVYETQGRTTESIDFLRGTRPDWIERDHLALHLEWHLALRLLADGAFDECLSLVDERLPTTDRAFGLTDLTSLLWRLELAGCDVGARWPALAARWRDHDQLHTTGFLDLHAAMAFSACPDDPGAARFWDGLEACHPDGDSQNARTFDEVVRPLAAAVRDHRTGRHEQAAVAIASLASDTHRVGGSHAQRDLFARTGAASRRLVDPPNTGSHA
ncbi:MAG: tetratricopeptide repeat protein [Actinomycetota bacterium]|nr:tetratricopeptide repeat protein [Actinomycetota bacterium]MED6327995.1 tetratricopeptide repeat protein [Actinomycetota bacterium]